MARSGLYKSDVKKARDALIAQARNPSVDAVRVELGNTGSKTTIHKYLKELEEEDGGAGAKRASISDALQDLVERLAARLNDEAEERVTVARQIFDKKSVEYDAGLVAAQAENTKMQDRLRDVETAFAKQGVDLAAAREAQQQESIGRKVVDQQLADLKERLAENEAHRRSLEDKHRHAYEALEHYRQSVKEQRDQDEIKHEQQVQQLRTELRHAQQSIIVKQEEVTRLNQDGARLVAELTHTRQALHIAQESERRSAQRIDALHAVEHRNSTLVVQAVDMGKQIETLKEQLNDVQGQVAESSAQVRSLELLLAKAEGKCEALETRIFELQSIGK